ncbi:MAG TPA: transcription antitermination factor NusB [Oscillospiraceae bacterium]|nr:transcription antitermination factor NusB [Oscillospiraceae bacterium]HPF55633.1 transcription antitermination factor NusB [Clostridiales bacterium]HPK34200.1 transcription antitermination factor NusB [Oscillospiraceae bacterium]HPR74897.1 transcription antitermination factor NusB [Oscillospiraceae bacterium]
MNRRESREAGFLIAFEQSFTGQDIEAITELAKEYREFKYDTYSLELAKGVAENRDQIDNFITENLKDWTLGRISKVSLAILRCCIYEFKIGKTVPEEIAINEAVELSKKYSLPEDTAFVNGILGSISRIEKKQEEEPDEKKQDE